MATVTVSRKPVLLTTELPGHTAPYLIAEIRPQVSGLIQKRLFKEGSDVKAGEVLYEIDPAPFNAAMDSAAANLEAMRKAADQARAAVNASIAGVARQQATVEFARTNRRRYEDLLKEKAVSASASDQAVTDAHVADATLTVTEAQVQSDRAAVASAEAAIQQAAAALQTARINLGYTRITAPISGRIGKSAVTDGAIVTAYQSVALAAIQQLDPIYVDVPQSTTELNAIEAAASGKRGASSHNGGTDSGQRCGFTGRTAPRIHKKGRFKFRDVTVDPTTGSVILRIGRPQSRWDTPARHVRPSDYRKKAFNEQAILDPPAGRLARSQRQSRLTLIVDASKAKVQQRDAVDSIARWAIKWLVIPQGFTPRRSRDRRGHAEGAPRNGR